MKLGRVSNTSKKRKPVIKIWCLDIFGNYHAKLCYQNALRCKVHKFSECINSKIERGMKGQELMNEVVME